MLWKQTTLNCRGVLVDLLDPIVMGIINVTPDSFYDQSRASSSVQILKKIEEMRRDGVTIIDIGAMSTRPGSQQVTVEEEMERLKPALLEVRRTFPDQVLSIDTSSSHVARWALDQGVHMINDISAWEIDARILDVVVEYKVPYVLTHMQGVPETMQQDPTYNDALVDVLNFLITKLGILLDHEIVDVIVDPGFGFGKTIAQNYALIQNLQIFKMLERPILVGLSRKSMIQKVLDVDANNALNGTTALHMVALQHGAQILRAHDVKEAMECIKIYKAMTGSSRGPSR